VLRKRRSGGTPWSATAEYALRTGAYTSSSSSEYVLRRLFRLTALATPFRTMSGGGDSLDCFLERGGEGDLGLGEDGIDSSPEESPPARASSSASRSAMVRQYQGRSVYSPRCIVTRLSQ
jgi:hypothetical protein